MDNLTSWRLPKLVVHLGYVWRKSLGCPYNLALLNCGLAVACCATAKNLNPPTQHSASCTFYPTSTKAYSPVAVVRGGNSPWCLAPDASGPAAY